MSEEQLLKTIDQLVRRVAKLEAMVGGKPKETWVKASHITALTGWNNEGMRRARETKIIKFKKEHKGVKGFFYLLESLPPQFIIQQRATA